MTNDKTFNLWVSINNHGDGGASVSVHKNENDAVKEDESQDDCYSESTVSQIKLKIINGKIHHYNEWWNSSKLEWVREWTELESE